jgi:hypothetical protein
LLRRDSTQDAAAAGVCHGDRLARFRSDGERNPVAGKRRHRRARLLLGLQERFWAFAFCHHDQAHPPGDPRVDDVTPVGQRLHPPGVRPDAGQLGATFVVAARDEQGSVGERRRMRRVLDHQAFYAAEERHAEDTRGHIQGPVEVDSGAVW